MKIKVIRDKAIAVVNAETGEPVEGVGMVKFEQINALDGRGYVARRAYVTIVTDVVADELAEGEEAELPPMLPVIDAAPKQP